MTVSTTKANVTPTAPPAKDLSDPQPNMAGEHQRELQQGEIKINTYIRFITRITRINHSPPPPSTKGLGLEEKRLESEQALSFRFRRGACPEQALSTHLRVYSTCKGGFS